MEHSAILLTCIKWAATWENRIIAYAKTKTQISFAVTAKLISVFVFATWIVQSLYFLNPKFQASSHLQWLSSPVCVRPGRNPRRPVFWRRGSNDCQSWKSFLLSSLEWLFKTGLTVPDQTLIRKHPYLITLYHAELALTSLLRSWWLIPQSGASVKI